MKQTVDNKVLNTLKRRNPHWVSTVVLAKSANSFAVSSAVSRLRSRGYDIECKTDNLNPQKRGWYRFSSW